MTKRGHFSQHHRILHATNHGKLNGTRTRSRTDVVKHMHLQQHRLVCNLDARATCQHDPEMHAAAPTSAREGRTAHTV
eukprot:9825100-Alexandrium_andersonii.AAC.1